MCPSITATRLQEIPIESGLGLIAPFAKVPRIFFASAATFSSSFLM